MLLLLLLLLLRRRRRRLTQMMSLSCVVLNPSRCAGQQQLHCSVTPIPCRRTMLATFVLVQLGYEMREIGIPEVTLSLYWGSTDLLGH